MKTDLFQSCGHCWVFHICWHIECSTFTALSFRILNSSVGIPSPPLTLFLVMFPKAYLTLDSWMSGSRWVIMPLWLSGSLRSFFGEGNVTPLQYSYLENPMDGGAWKAAVHGVAKSQAWLSNFTFTFQFHALEKELATHSSVLAWRIPGTGEPGGLPSMGSHRVGHNWSNLAAVAAAAG